jgi:hypothetical protein
VRPQIILLVGLPGCDKTTYLNELRRDGWSDFDDFKSGSIDNSREFHKAARCEALVGCLRNGQRCVVADIDFCKSESRDDAESFLDAAVPGLELRWRFFAHDAGACEENVGRRNRDSLAEDLEKLREYSTLYSVPEGGDALPVVS